MPASTFLRKPRFGLYSAAFGALAILLWPGEPPLNRGGLQSGWGKPGLSPAILDQATVVCCGRFSQMWRPFTGTSSVSIPCDQYRVVGGLRKIVPFYVEHYWRGQGPGVLQVAVVQPTEFSYGHTWFFPGKEKLLVALKPDDTGSSALRLVDQRFSWLVLRGETAADPSPATAGDEVVHAARDYLAAYAQGTEEIDPVTLMEPVRIGALMPGQVSDDNNFVIAQTLATLGQFRDNDAKTIALIKSYLTPAMSPPIYEEAIHALIQIDPIGGWNLAYDLYESPSLSTQDSYLISIELPAGITDKTIGQLDPARIQKLMQAGPRIEEDISRALEKIKSPNLIPYYEKFLSEPDEKIQYSGMGAIYILAGGAKSGLTFPATSIFENDPEGYLAPFRRWCEQHRPLPNP